MAVLARRLARAALRALLLLGSHDQALKLAHRQIARDPLNRHALASRAHLLVGHGKPTQALADLLRLVQLAPDRASTWFNLGYVQSDLGELAAAVGSFTRAVDIDPGMDCAWYGLALCHIRQGRWDDAVSALQRNTELQPLSPHGWYQLARVHLERGEVEAAQCVLLHLNSFEPKVAAQLQRETSLRLVAG